MYMREGEVVFLSIPCRLLALCGTPCHEAAGPHPPGCSPAARILAGEVEGSESGAVRYGGRAAHGCRGRAQRRAC